MSEALAILILLAVTPVSVAPPVPWHWAGAALPPVLAPPPADVSGPAPPPGPVLAPVPPVEP
jgi:hypothetical protein